MLEKTLERGDRAVVRVSSVRREEELDMFLWMDPAAGFLPHGRAGVFRGGGEDFTTEQPVLLTTATGEEEASSEVVNGAKVLFHWQEGGDGMIDIGEDGGRFSLCCLLYEGEDEDARVMAEDLWGRLCKTEGIEAGFWHQERGGWRKRGEGDENKDKNKDKDKAIAKEEKEEERAEREEKQVEQAEERKTEEREGIVVGVIDPSQESLF